MPIKTTWVDVLRPGYFGRKRDEKIAQYNSLYGEGGWRLVWRCKDEANSFGRACILFYERSYYEYLSKREEDLDFICTYGECIDNAPTNTLSGRDYEKQEAYSTHIQDIAIRNVLFRLGLEFTGPKDKILVIRSADTEGYRFGPGNIPFYNPSLIHQPSTAPKWAKPGSVEDFWQSNKWLQKQVIG